MAETNAPIRVLAWEVTRRCPMACQHCRGASRNHLYDDELSTSKALSVIESLHREGWHPLIIFTGGEPMYRDDLPQLVAHANALGFPCALAPCGRFATVERLQELKDAGIRTLSISVDGSTAQTHDTFRGVNGAFELALHAMAAARHVSLNFQINHTVTKANRQTLRAMRDFALEQGASRIDYFFLVPVGRGKGIADLCLNDEETEVALKEILALDAEGTLPVHVTCEPRILALAETLGRTPTSRQNGCMAGAGFCFLSHIGELQPCGFFAQSGGNIRENACDLPQTYRASPLFQRLHGGSICLARKFAQKV